MKKLSDYRPEDILGHECRHVTYCPPPAPNAPDLHIIKRVTHVREGDKIIQIPNVIKRENFERKFWIEKPGMQNHREKREFQEMEHLDEFVCTQSQFEAMVRRKLRERTEKGRKRFNLPYPSDRDDVRQLSRSPYLYGTDVSSTTLLKKMYMDLFPDLRSPSSMAATDTETNMFSKEEEIIMQTISMKERVFTAVKRSFFAGQVLVEERLQETFQTHLGDIAKARNITWEVVLVDTAADVVKAVIAKAHEWQPDFLAVWNILFDMKKMLEALEANGDHPKDVFSHPKMPAAWKHFDFYIGKPSKKKANGDEMPLSPSQRWHIVTTPASFSFIDAMCAYRQIRTGQQEEPSYSLGDILDKHLKRRKLDFKEAEGFKEGEWHRFMQEFYKFEYVVYNVFDCIGMELLDEKTNDLRLNFPLYSGPSDYGIFNSQPRKLCNKFFFTLLDQNRVLASTSDRMQDENDERTVNGQGWIKKFN